MPNSDSPPEPPLESKRPMEETLSWAVHALVLLAALWSLGAFLACSGIAGALEEFGGSNTADSGVDTMLGGVVYLMFAIGAVSSAMWRRGSVQMQAVRATEVGPYLPAVMAVSLLVLPLSSGVFSVAFLQDGVAPSWSGYVAWLAAVIGFALGAIWQPLIPRVTAILAGAIGGVAVSGILGFLFFESSLSHGEGCGLGGGLLAVLALEVGLVLLSRMSVLWLAPVVAFFVVFLAVVNATGPVLFFSYLALLAIVGLAALLKRARLTARPLTCAVVSAALAAGMAAVGADIGFF